MPCEACNIQFTVFKRKKSCNECRRLYCSNCLTKNKERTLCKRCVIFTTRPLSKIELLKLKAKDLIFYLQSKHISTTGCVEKEELVNLVLIHVDNSNNFTPDQQSPTFSMGTESGADSRANPFDQIRNTCQNLFTTFTEKIATDFNFEFKQNQSDRQSNVCEDQPRYSNSFRTVPSFASNGIGTDSNGKPQRPTTMSENQSNERRSSDQKFQSSPTNTGNSSSTSTPSLLKSSSQSTLDDAQNVCEVSPSNGHADVASAAVASTSTKSKPTYAKIKELSKMECCNEEASGCECSDDELITKFRERYSDQPTSPTEPPKLVTTPVQENADNQTGSSNGSTKATSVTPLKEETSALESSDISSFEDLGAVGGQQLNNNIPSTSDPDKWQVVNPTWNIDDTASTSSIMTEDKTETNNILYTTNLPNSITELPQASENQRQNETFPIHSERHDLRSKLEKTLNTRQTHRKITRRQSDGIVYMASTSNSGHRTERFDSDDEDRSSTSEDVSYKIHAQQSCRKCGKNKGDLKKYIARFRHQLEKTTSFSETEIREQLGAFLAFLEHSSALDNKDDESTEHVQSPLQQFVPEVIELDEFDDDEYDDEAGIHVYGSNDEATTSSHPPRQFFDLNSIEKKEHLEDLTVKQLKEVLMLNRVDFKGCCEKSELLERVQRLWDDVQSCPAVDKLASGDLCKICMDAAIECVLLECGHMATCTSCGKVLSECPICRQYIVRVVRFFKA